MRKAEKSDAVLDIVNRVERLTLTTSNITKRLVSLQTALEELQRDIYLLKENTSKEGKNEQVKK